MDTRSLLEAILFVAEEPVPSKELAEVLEVAVAEIEEELVRWRHDLDARGAGIVLKEVGGGWRLYTRSEMHPYLERWAASTTATKLSSAALETLAVVAYRQPVSRNQIAEIRGVDSESALRTLERRGLVIELGRVPAPGTPAIYGTSEVFLEKLGLRGIDDLPPLADHVPPADVVESLEETFRLDP